jgi:predicted TIM-barrel fold metal-dependent hydrolase
MDAVDVGMGRFCQTPRVPGPDVVVDTHTHVIAPDEERFPLRPPPSLTHFRGWYREVPVSVEGLLEEMDGAGVDKAVLVQAYSAYGSDNAYVTAAGAAHADRGTVVVIVDGGTAGAASLRELAEQAEVTGVRLFAIGNPSLPRLDDEFAAPVWDAAIALELRVVVTILAPQLPELRTVLARHPDTPIVLDHCGFPDVTGGASFSRADELFALATAPNLHLKVSSHLLELVEVEGDPRDFVDRLAAEFGVERLLWGSDYPQTHDRPYAALVDLGRLACSRLPPDAQRAFLGGNAVRLWPALA